MCPSDHLKKSSRSEGALISSRCAAENEHLFTSPDTLSVYLIANTQSKLSLSDASSKSNKPRVFKSHRVLPCLTGLNTQTKMD